MLKRFSYYEEGVVRYVFGVECVECRMNNAIKMHLI